MNCSTCSRRALSLFIRSIHPESQRPLIRFPPFYVVPKYRSFATARPLRNTDPVSKDPETPYKPSVPPPTRKHTDSVSEDQQTPSRTPRKQRDPNSKRKRDRAAKAEATDPEKPKKKWEPWQLQKKAIKEKLADKGPWNPRKRLSPDALDGIRHLHKTQPDKFTTPVLAEYFKVSPEAIRRILKSKWQPSDKEEEERARRWEKRGENIWSNLVELGVKPPKKWREMGVGKAKPGQVPTWKSKARNRVPVNDSVRDEVIPFVEVPFTEADDWQKIHMSSRVH